MSNIYTDPIAQVIITDVSKGYSWNWGSPQFPFLTSVNFSWDLKSINAFSVGIDIPYDMALDYLDINKTPFKKNNVVKARIGYASGGWTEWESGYLTDGGKGLSISADGLSGALEIAWVSPQVAQYTLSKDVLQAAEWDSVKLLESIGGIIGLNVFMTAGAKTMFRDWKHRSRVKHLNRAVFWSGLADKGVMSIVSELCQRSNVEFWMAPRGGVKTLWFATAAEREKGYAVAPDAKETRKYVIRGILDESQLQYPCYSMSPEDDSNTWIRRAASASASGVTATAIDTENGEDVKVEVKPEDAETPVSGSIEETAPADIRTSEGNANQLVADAAKTDGTLGTFVSAPFPDGGSTIFKNLVRQYSRQGDPAGKLTLETIGVPKECTGNLCEFRGAGKLFDGNYLIEGLTHAWSPGTWNMTLKVMRRGVKAKEGSMIETKGGQRDA